jgi:2-iminobutanoate/2-iminopropanoate deaminase
MHRLAAIALIALVPVAACHRGARPTPTPTVQFITSEGPSTRPFSPAVRVGNMLYLSGQIGTDKSGGLVAGGIETETRQTMDNIRDLLQRSGSSLDRVVKCTVMLADIREWDRMNVIYGAYFPRNKPARSALGVNGLALGARVEIECWATVG